MSVISNLLSHIKNNELSGKNEVTFRPTSKLSTEVLRLMQEHGYIGEFEIIEDGRGRVYKIRTLHKINNCNAISPRTPIKHEDIEKWERRFLPAQGFGILMLSTPDGLVTHTVAKEKRIGGRLIAYVY